MSDQDKRVDELLQRWLASVELHLRYLKLDDAAYARAEDWPKHQRPNALVLTLARTRLLELKAHVDERKAQGDTRFGDALELMSFLTGLLGSEHIERFVPLATGRATDSGVSATVEQPRIRAAAKPAAAQRGNHAHSAHAGAKSGGSAAARTPTGTHRRPARTAATPPTPPPAPTRANPAPARVSPAPATASRSSEVVVAQVVADAIRLLEWGREWPAVAGLIARMADRPGETEVWKILRAHRAQILSRARRTGS
jgi:hypothetical protein